VGENTLIHFVALLAATCKQCIWFDCRFQELVAEGNIFKYRAAIVELVDSFLSDLGAGMCNIH
jgi:hypothetical protein